MTIVSSTGVAGDSGGTGRNQSRRHLLGVFRAGKDCDAGSIDALLLHEIVLGVDGARSAAFCGPIFSSEGGVADQVELCVRRALQVECEVIEASLAFVVHARRAMRVAIKADRAEAGRGRVPAEPQEP